MIGRRQRVIVNGECSSWESMSGVPQRSVLGPIMFVLFINNLPDVVSSTIKMFADDMKIYRQIDAVQDIELLQHDIDKKCAVRH